MDDQVDLVVGAYMSGYIGVQDCFNTQYEIRAKQSFLATPEQNTKLIESLMAVYKDYLEEVARLNNGLY